MPKLITSAPHFARKANPYWADARWTVRHDIAPAAIDLLLHIQGGQESVSKFSVSLLWNDEAVRRTCVRFAHGSLDPLGVHLHKYQDWAIMDHAEELTDFPRDDPAQGVLKACELYGITFSGQLNVPSLTRQKRLFPD